MTATTLWECPFPIDQAGDPYLRGPYRWPLKPSADMKLEMEISFTHFPNLWMRLFFWNVVAYRASYGLYGTGFIREAYGGVARIDDSPWLADVEQRYYKPRGTMMRQMRDGSKAPSGLALPRSMQPQPIQHLMIGFDSGPWFEFICSNFRVAEDRFEIYPEIPDWEFEVNEIHPNYFEASGRAHAHRRLVVTGSDKKALLAELRARAKSIEKGSL